MYSKREMFEQLINEEKLHEPGTGRVIYFNERENSDLPFVLLNSDGSVHTRMPGLQNIDPEKWEVMAHTKDPVEQYVLGVIDTLDK